MAVFENWIRWCVRLIGQVVHGLKTVVTGIAFWTGIIAPLLYLVFIIPGIQTRSRFNLFLVLIAINYLALLLGYPYYNRTDT